MQVVSQTSCCLHRANVFRFLERDVMAKYRKKPLVIEAFQMTLKRRWDNSEWPVWLHEAWSSNDTLKPSLWIDPAALIADGHGAAAELICGTLEGAHKITWDDWIIKGVQGEIYPIKDAIFRQTYDPVDAGENESDGN